MTPPAITHYAPGKAKFQALGRLPRGTMNRCETAYASYLDIRKRAGEIIWWKFEAIKLRLADNTFLTVDFFLMLSNGELEAHDTKGSKAIVTDDARVKIKVAADTFPFRFFLCYPQPRSKGMAWDFEEISRG